METQTLYFSSDELFEIYRTATSKVAELKESTRCLDLDKESAAALKDRYKHRIDILTDVIAKIEPMVLHP